MNRETSFFKKVEASERVVGGFGESAEFERGWVSIRIPLGIGRIAVLRMFAYGKQRLRRKSAGAEAPRTSRTFNASLHNNHVKAFACYGNA
jgi:hypothetical protein